MINTSQSISTSTEDHAISIMVASSDEGDFGDISYLFCLLFNF